MSELNAPLSSNEYEILGHQVAGVLPQLQKITHLLESRLGAGSDLAVCARAARQGCAALAENIHQQHETNDGQVGDDNATRPTPIKNKERNGIPSRSLARVAG